MATIHQKIVFKNATTKQLYSLYMDPKLHAHIAGGPVKVSEKAGGKLDVFGGYATGKTLQVVKNKLIVQTWFGSDWGTKGEDSYFILSFEQKGKDAEVNMLHANVPDDQVADLNKGWQDYYWKPWKQYLAGNEIKRP